MKWHSIGRTAENLWRSSINDSNGKIGGALAVFDINIFKVDSLLAEGAGIDLVIINERAVEVLKKIGDVNGLAKINGSIRLDSDRNSVEAASLANVKKKGDFSNDNGKN